MTDEKTDKAGKPDKKPEPRRPGGKTKRGANKWLLRIFRGYDAGEMKPKADIEPPDLENFAYKIAVAPSASRVCAWGKLRECERRIELVKWAESLNDPRLAERRVFLYDSVSAFLLTFEATIQILKNQWKKSVKVDFDLWLKSLSEYDLHMRGLRTLRHFEAHVEGGTNVKAVSERLGHASVTTTLETYTHVSPGMQADVSEEIERLLGGKK